MLVPDPVLQSPLMTSDPVMVPFNSVLMQYNLNTAFPPLMVKEIETH